MSLTPQQAFEHCKALWPNIDFIGKHEGGHDNGWVKIGYALERLGTIIDWPPGVDRWPPPEPKYREPTMADRDKMIEVRLCENDEWVKAKLIYIRNGGFRFITIKDASESLGWYAYARIKDEGATS
jgi:hypothetical protein